MHSGKRFHTDLRDMFGRAKSPLPRIQADEDLVLRAVTPSDDEQLYVMIESNRWHLEPWLSWIEDIHTLQDTRKFLKSVSYKSIYAGGWVFGIEFQGQLVGLMDLNEGNHHDRFIALGYWLDADAEGQGLITKTVISCMNYLFEEQNVRKVLIKCATNNVRSEAIPKRLGFTWDGISYNAGMVQEQSVDLVKYSMTKTDWTQWKRTYPHTQSNEKDGKR